MARLHHERRRRVTRCEDCLSEFTADSQRFVVLKQMRELPPDTDPAEARVLQGMCYDQVEVCADCAGWYHDDAIEVSNG